MIGQGLVELTLTLPVLLLLLMGIIGAGYLELSLLRDQNGVTVLARVAEDAPGDSWKGIVEDENRRSGCHADPLMPDITYPDGNPSPGSRISLTWFCHLSTGWLFDGTPMTVSAEGVLR